MKRQILFLFYLTLLFPSIMFGQRKPLKIIEPILDFTPILDENVLKRELAIIEKIYSAHKNDPKPERYMNERHQDIYYWNYPDRENLWDTGQIGDGWYNCAWPESISASSELKSTNGINYKAGNAHDFSLRTAWVEGVEGNGIGESITYCFPKGTPPVPITTVCIFNGYMKSDKTWMENSRVKQLKLYINGKPYALLNLKDTKSFQLFDIGAHKAEKSKLYFKFEITDVYKGDKYDDVAISEIEFDGTGCLCFAKGTMISTLDGEKPIEQLQKGDKILSLNPKTNEIEEATILELANRKHHLYELDFGNTKIKTTADHPFYFEGKFYSIIENTNYNIESNKFSVGQNINYLTNGQLKATILQEIRKLESYEKTYTITKLNRNNLFFANGLCVSVEKIKK